MIFSLFRRSGNQTVIERLYTAIVTASRQPALFTSLGMIDTFEGRFESLTLHAALVLRRLNALPVPGPEMAQDLIDTVFRHFDRTLREMGVGDTTVPKRMKRLAEAFLGRSAAYDEALRQGRASLMQALARNIHAAGTSDLSDGHSERGDAAIPPAATSAIEALTRYVEAMVATLADMPAQSFIDGTVPFPDPARFTSEVSI